MVVFTPGGMHPAAEPEGSTPGRAGPKVLGLDVGCSEVLGRSRS